MTRIIANIVGRNESAHYLVPVLERLSQQVDDIVFTDDASDDNTVEIVRGYTDNINELSEPTFSTDEGKLRQASWDFLQSAVNPTTEDWILAIDCDELLYSREDLHELVDDERYDVMNVWFYHMWNETHYRVDGGWCPHGSTRLFRYPPNSKFKDSKLACGSEPEAVAWTARSFPGSYLIDSGLRMQHLSYIKDEDKRAKYDRYVQIDGGKFHASSHIQSIVDPPDRVSLEEWKE